MKTISILGSTGSIGTQAIEVAKKHGIKVNAISANNNTALLEQQARELKVSAVCIYNEKLYKDMKRRLADTSIKIFCGMSGLCAIASMRENDLLLNSVVGMVGLLPTLAAIDCCKDIALANKETLVAGGNLVMRAAAKNGAKILPVDSEHSAIFQCLQGNKALQLNKLILTASGGPFFGKTREELRDVTVEQALCHPNWSMGSKITVDSATLMNKGLEFIEAKWLFDVSPEQIEIVVHRQSVLHSAVEYKDHSVIGQMGVPDMKIPIQYALLYPERLECDVKSLSLTDYGKLTFEKPDYDTFECLSTCIKAAKSGGGAACAANSANEEAVKLFLDRKISFLRIGELVAAAAENSPYSEPDNYTEVMECDKWAREFVHSNI